MNSVLGRIQLGTWELGRVPDPVILPGTATLTAAPVLRLAVAGGLASRFSSVLGNIVLGLWELGAVPAASLSGLKVAQGALTAFPTLLLRVTPPPGKATLTAYPSLSLLVNLGALLVVMTAFPSAVFAVIQPFSSGIATISPLPVLILTVTQPQACSMTAFPTLNIFILGSQSVDCNSGQNPPPPATPAGNRVY